MTKKETEDTRKILEIKKELAKYIHEVKMEELKFKRETERLFHENELTRIRIKSAEIKRTQRDRAMARNY